MGLDSTHLIGRHLGSGRRELYVIVTEDSDGRVFICGSFFVRLNARRFIAKALKEIRAKLEQDLAQQSKVYCPDVSFFVDECQAGMVWCVRHPMVNLCDLACVCRDFCVPRSIP